MSVVNELLRKEEDGTLSFGNYELTSKTKVSDFEYNGDIYKVKTFNEITKLERNDMLVYESEPGTAVTHFAQNAEGVAFNLEAAEDVQVILGLEENTEYDVVIAGVDNGPVKTNAGGKLVLSVEAQSAGEVAVKVTKIG